ncbi:MAG: CRISPR-associated endonuclease Cas3'' [Fimbriiglobus sp.]
MATPTFLAHSKPPQDLREHLREVADLAEKFARDTGIPGLPAAAPAAGWRHDLGKYRPEFQKYIRIGKTGEPTGHKQAGAVWADDACHTPLTAAILGHHGGMPDYDEFPAAVEDEDHGRPVLKAVWPTATANCPELLGLDLPEMSDDGAATDLFARVLFSCLVDADWTDTADNERKYHGWEPVPQPPSLDPTTRLERVLESIRERAAEGRDRNPDLAAIRAEVLTACLGAAETSPGAFTLTVPTGGGKTLSGLAFALRHAAFHTHPDGQSRFRRVIYVAPYLSILDQNVAVLRAALGLTAADPDLFEHHSLAEPAGGTGDERETAARARRAERWDAPVVVTTNVQFFQSLFSNRPGSCRKLHNIAGSVILLDECQTLPPEFVKPTCEMLNQLVEVLGCTVVFCTATQPAFDHEKIGDHRIRAREIIPAGLRLFDRLKRVRLHWPTSRNERLEWPEVAARMTALPAALGVVNTKAAARDLFAALRCARPDDAVFHLSTDMCPAHRLAVLAAIKARLAAKAPVFVASTQLIEAGVDIDFPAVFREMAPLEAIIQAAGRANREGLILDAGGRVEVFRSVDGKCPKGWYALARDKVESVFLAAGREPKIDDPGHIREYFEHLYWSGGLDAKNVCGMRHGLKFDTCARTYEIIDDDTVPVVIATWPGHTDEVEALLAAVRAKPVRANFRRLIPFQVNVRRTELEKLQKLSRSLVRANSDVDLFVWYGSYCEKLGITDAPPDLLMA